MHPHEKQSQKVVEQPYFEKERGVGVEECTQVETSKRGKFRARWAEGVHAAKPPGVKWGDVQN